MWNPKVVAIRMSKHLKDIKFVFPKYPDLDNFKEILPEEPFSGSSIAFLNALSVILRNDQRANKFPEIITFSFGMC